MDNEMQMQMENISKRHINNQKRSANGKIKIHNDNGI